LISLGLLCGCEWTSGGGVSYWNSSQVGDWANFSGYYIAGDSGIVVKTYSISTTNNQVTGEQLGTGDGSKTAFSGLTANLPVRGTLSIVVGGYHFIDSGGGTSSATAGTVSLTVTPADGSAGTFNFSTRVWTLTFPAPIASGTAILADYFYTSTTSVQGNHGKPIYTFIVYQIGSSLQIIDNNNSRYDGVIGDMRMTGEEPAVDDEGNQAAHAGPVEAQFSVSGVSQGYKVTLVGLLQGNIDGQYFRDRAMNGTYIEEGGFQANFNAKAQASTYVPYIPTNSSSNATATNIVIVM
jgi:hypothetical protein